MASSPVDKPIKVSLDRWKFTQCRVGKLGLLVSIGSKYLPLSPDIDTAVVGHCACLAAAKEVAKLSSFDLPTPDWEKTAASIRRYFPAGFEDCCGVWFTIDSAHHRASEWDEYKTHLIDVLETLLQTTSLKSLLKYKPSLLVAVPSQPGVDVECFSFNSNATELNLSPVEYIPGSVSNHLVRNTVMVQLSASVPLFLTTDTKVQSAMSSLIKRIQSPATFFFVPSHQLLFSATTPEDRLLPAPSKEDLRNNKSPSSATLSQRKQLGFNCNAAPLSPPLLVNILESASPQRGGSKESDTPMYAPTLTMSEPLTGPCVKVAVPLNVMGFFRPTLPLFEVATALKEAIATQLSYAADVISWQDNMASGVKVFTTPVHTQVCPVTIVVPDKYLKVETEETEGGKGRPTYSAAVCRGPQQDRLQCQPRLRQLLSLRNTVCEEYFQTINCVLAGQQLRNPHLAVKHNPIAGGKTALVQGDYLYYHYMQDGFNDNVWGCAYRSLQTLASWFLLQMYTTKAPPTHRQIQQALVDVGDKEASLVGSKEWIGSFEVSTCLNHLLGINCKIHHCNSGADMANVGGMLLSHFHVYGTPIMIGGGVLAHTILGVDYNESTGEIRFLILDPHYTGRDELKTIVDKGWCGWKSVSFWDKTAHYNLCMPLTDKL